jgi:hypothetical protein
VPKVPVVDGSFNPASRKMRECEHHLAPVVRALSAHDIEGAARAYAVAVERGGEEFLECCQKLPATLRRKLAEVAKIATKGEKPR